MANAPYYRNTGTQIGSFTIGELTRALDDSAAYFDGPTPDSAKQSTLDSMVDAAKKVITPLRRLGFVFTIGRSFSEGTSNHGGGDTFDLVPGSKDPSDCYAMAKAAEGLNACDQIWIEASDDEGNYHLHVKAAKSGNKNPDMKFFKTVDGGGAPLTYVERTINSLSSVIE